MGKYSPLRLRDHPKNILFLIAYPGNVINGTGTIDLFSNPGMFIAIPKQNLFLVAHLDQGLFIGCISPVPCGYGNPVCTIIGELMGDGCVVIIGFDIGVPANEPLCLIHP